MTLEEIRNYCLNKKGVTEDFPFDEETLVLRVMNKMFLLTNIYPPLKVNLKCDPERAIELREKYEEITPGYHMNKQHWNTVDLEGTLKHDFVFELIDHSYELIVNSLKKAQKEELKNL